MSILNFRKPSPLKDLISKKRLLESEYYIKECVIDCGTKIFKYVPEPNSQKETDCGVIRIPPKYLQVFGTFEVEERPDWVAPKKQGFANIKQDIQKAVMGLKNKLGKSVRYEEFKIQKAHVLTREGVTYHFVFSHGTKVEFPMSFFMLYFDRINPIIEREEDEKKL